MQMASASKFDVETELSSMRLDLMASENKVKQLEEKILTFKNERRKCEESRAKEKNLSSDLQASLDSLSHDMAAMSKNLEALHEENENFRSTIHKKDEDIRCLNENAKLYTKEKAANLEKLQSLTVEKVNLLEELKQTKQTLQEARTQHKNSELKIREVGQKLSAAECEAKEKATTINSEVKKIEMANKENEELRKHIQKIEERLVTKENELTSVVLMNQGIEGKAIQLDDQLKKNEQSRTQEVIALTKEMGELKAKNKQLQEVYVH